MSTTGHDRLLGHAAASASIERCPADADFARSTVEGLDSDYVMFAASRGDWGRAMADSYADARKAVTMLLLASGWRVPDQPGKHLKIAQAVLAWLGEENGNGPRLAGSFERSRKARNNEAYPDAKALLPPPDALRQLTLDNARLVERIRAELALSERPEAVPTDDNVRRWSDR